MVLERFVKRIDRLPRMVEIPDIYNDGSVSWETEPVNYSMPTHEVLINYLVRLNAQTQRPEEILAAVGCSISQYLSSESLQEAVMQALEQQFGEPDYMFFSSKVFSDSPELRMGFPTKEENPNIPWLDALGAYTFDTLQSFNDPDLDFSDPLILRLSPLTPSNFEMYLRAEADDFAE